MIKLESEQQPLWQWDTGRKLVLTEVPAGAFVDFIQVGFQTRSAIAQEQDGTVSVRIPNEMLHFDKDLKVYIRQIHGDDTQTVEEASFPVLSRPKPDDYIANEAEVLLWHQLEDRIHALEHGYSGGGILCAVQYIHQKLTSYQQAQARENIGASSLIELQADIETALEKAKASGEFNGPAPVKGVDYWTEADKQELVKETLAAISVWEGGSY